MLHIYTYDTYNMSKEEQKGGRASIASLFPLARRNPHKSRAMEHYRARPHTHTVTDTNRGNFIRRAAKPFLVSKTVTKTF